MSLEVRNLSKQFGQQWAVDNVSFEVQKGHVVGFLGPNGAGKSTTMKIATGFLPPTNGSVEVCGVDVQQNPLKVKKTIGYLAENNPLYLDMYVHEYLRFCGGLFGLRGQSLRSRVGEIIELCGLEQEQKKKIESLSKGYRQRIGIAQAMLHNPEVLILDEPTSGLDPNQLVEIRKLIKGISQNKTVIFSTHIMQEVQAICSRVIVINRGKIVADDSIRSLIDTASQKRAVTVEFEHPVDVQKLLKVKGILSVYTSDNGVYRIESEKAIDIRSELFRFATENNHSLIGLKVEEQSLESVFKQLTVDASPVLN